MNTDSSALNHTLGKHRINLLQAELLPKKVFLTLNNVVKLWIALLILMLALGALSQYRADGLVKQQQVLQSDNTRLTDKLATLEEAISQHKPSEQLLSKLAILQMDIANKKLLQKQLVDDQGSYITGFARAMSDLSSFHSSDISLSQVIINPNEITFSGIARSAEAVPRWLAKFEKSTVLSNKEFSHFSMKENDDKFIEFTVSSSLNSQIVSSTSPQSTIAGNK